MNSISARRRSISELNLSKEFIDNHIETTIIPTTTTTTTTTHIDNNNETDTLNNQTNSNINNNNNNNDKNNKKKLSRNHAIGFYLDDNNNNNAFTNTNTNNNNNIYTKNNNNKSSNIITIDENKVMSQLTASQNLYNQLRTRLRLSSFETQNVGLQTAAFKIKKYTINTKALQHTIYELLEHPYGFIGCFYRCFTFIIILLCILLSACTTLEPVSEKFKVILYWIDSSAIIFFLFEYCVRVWSSGCRTIYRGFKGRLKFMFRPLLMIDITAVIFGLLVFIFGSRNDGSKIYLVPTALTVLRLFQLVRLLYVDRKSQTWILLLNVLHKHKLELITSVYIGFIILLLSSYLILICERSDDPNKPPEPNTFHSFADALYWSIITMTTIGYGDMSPKTFYGKMIATGLCIAGVAFWVLPGGIIGSGFELKVEQRNRRKQFNRLLPAAASLIQSWWRMRVVKNIEAEEINIKRLVSVLKVYTRNAYIPENLNENDKALRRQLFKNLDPIVDASKSRESNVNESDSFLDKEIEEELRNKEFILNQLNPKQFLLIRMVLLLKFLVAKNKFKFAHKPYDFKDVMDQYTQGNMDVLMKIKELQRKIEINPKQPTLSKLSSFASTTTPFQHASYQRQISPKFSHRGARGHQRNDSESSSSIIQSRISDLENKFDNIERKLDKLLETIENNSRT